MVLLRDKLKLIFFGFIMVIFIMERVNASENLDIDSLNSYRTPTVVSGVYLTVWNVVFSHFSEHMKHKDIKEYLITITENENEFIVSFRKPTKKSILGGGDGDYWLKKNDFTIKDVKFYK